MRGGFSGGRSAVSALVLLVVALFASSVAGAAPPTDPVPMTSVTVDAAGISLDYPSSWTPLALTRDGRAAQLKALVATDPKLASALKDRPTGETERTKFRAVDLGRAVAAGVTSNVEVMVVPPSLPKRLARLAKGFEGGFRHLGTVRVLSSRRSMLDGAPALRVVYRVTLGNRASSSLEFGQLLVAPDGGERVSVLVAAAVDDTTTIDSVLDSVRVNAPVTDPGPLQFRPVLAALPPATHDAPSPESAAAIASCDVNRLAQLPTIPTSDTDAPPGGCAVLGFAAGGDDGRLFLGPARLTTTGVRDARPGFVSGQGYVIEVRLTKAGLAAFNDLARDLFSRPTPENEVAIVVDGKVFSNPRLLTSSFSGPIQISGSFSGSEAKSLAKEINLGAVGG